MKNHWLIALNCLVLLAFTNIMCAFQTSFWMQVLGSLPAPILWIVVMTYVILHRHLGEGVFMTYLITFILCAYTAEPFEQLLMANMVCLIFIQLVKNRIYWSSPNYFMLMAAATAGVQFLLILVLSQFLDHNPLRSPEFFHWTISFLLTMLVSLPMYRFLKWLDRVTQRDETAESTSGLSF